MLNKTHVVKKTERLITFTQATREALIQIMQRDERVFLMGLGVNDPKGVFGTTIGLNKLFGNNRVFEIPISENSVTGVAIGAAIQGLRPVMTHQRADFILMAMDQIINNAAKWHYMFGGQVSIPLTIRTFIGKGWGQGPQHSQNFQALFAHIPGLKVVTPATPYEVKGLLIASIEDNNPVIFIEHRWLSSQKGDVPEDYYSLPLGKARILKEGSDLTIVSVLEMALESLCVAKELEKHNIGVEVVNLCTIKPLDERTILNSLAKTGRLLIVDSGWMNFGVSAEVAAIVAEKGFDLLKKKIKRLGLPDAPVPTSRGLSKYFYISQRSIFNAIEEQLGLRIDLKGLDISDTVSDTPDNHFRGPF